MTVQQFPTTSRKALFVTTNFSIPEFRFKESHPSDTAGVNFFCPFYVGCTSNKVFICHNTCGTTRAVYLDLVANLSTHALLCFPRILTAHKGTQLLIISDNANTFQAAARAVSIFF